MSYEGYVQMLCANGHYQTDDGETEARCEVCEAKIGWFNGVDDTNCDSYGYIDMDQFRIGEPVYETCNLGHKHLVQSAVFKIPTEEETSKARTYRDSTTDQRVPC